MSNVIQFLEAMGSNSAMARMGAAEYEAALATLDAEDDVRDAMALRDHPKLNELLKGRPIMFCMVAAPQDEEPGREESPNEEEDENERKQDE